VCHNHTGGFGLVGWLLRERGRGMQQEPVSGARDAYCEFLTPVGGEKASMDPANPICQPRRA